MRKMVLAVCGGLLAVMALVAGVGITGERMAADFRAQTAHAQVMASARPIPDSPEKCRRVDPCWVGSPQDRRQGRELENAFALAGWLHVDAYQGFDNCWFLLDNTTGRSMFWCFPADGTITGGFNSPDPPTPRASSDTWAGPTDHA